MKKIFVYILLLTALAFANTKPSEVVQKINNKEYAEALKMLDEAISENPKSAKAFYLRSQVEYILGDASSAKRDLANAKQIETNVFNETGKYNFTEDINALKHFEEKLNNAQENNISTGIKSALKHPEEKKLYNPNFLPIIATILLFFVGAVVFAIYKDYKERVAELIKSKKELLEDINQYIEKVSETILQLKFDQLEARSEISGEIAKVESKKAQAVELSGKILNIRTTYKFQERSVLDKAESEIANYKKEFALIKGEIQESAQAIKRFYDSNQIASTYRQQGSDYNSGGTVVNNYNNGSSLDFLAGMMVANAFAPHHVNHYFHNNGLNEISPNASTTSRDSRPALSTNDDSTVDTSGIKDSDDWDSADETEKSDLDSSGSWGGSSDSESSSSDSW